MNILVGYMLGKMIGKLIAAILTLAFRVLGILFTIVARILKYTFKGISWFAGKLWEEGCEAYNEYKLNRIKI